jgi:uncharacterized protein YgiM (DUF1202 family)
MLIVWATFAQVPTTTGQTRTPEKPVIAQGEVTTNDLYVRSGPSLNHYTVTKLNAGDRVTVVGESGDWLEILPPTGVYSLISGDYVDSPDGKTGVVNGDNVRVRTGSVLNKNKYTVQRKLSKGAQVDVLGREPDGFLRIKPPEGATVWVSRRFVEYVPDERLRTGSTAQPSPSTPTTAQPTASKALPAAGKPGTGQPTPPGTTVANADKTMTSPPDEGEPATATKKPSAFASYEPTTERRRLEKLDEEVRSELAKPAVERRLEPLIQRYKKIADQSTDDFANRYASARVAQLTNMNDLIQTVREVHGLVDDAEARRRQYLEDRARLRTAVTPTRTGLDAKGELRVSAVHPPDSFPRRYRLVNTKAPSGQTIGYVEIPRGSTIDVATFLGRYVGVRASNKRWETGVNPIPIFVARELVLLEKASPQQDKTD